MKKNYLYLLAMVMLAMFVFVSCSDDDEGNEENNTSKITGVLQNTENFIAAKGLFKYYADWGENGGETYSDTGEIELVLEDDWVDDKHIMLHFYFTASSLKEGKVDFEGLWMRRILGNVESGYTYLNVESGSFQITNITEKNVTVKFNNYTLTNEDKTEKNIFNGTMIVQLKIS